MLVCVVQNTSLLTAPHTLIPSPLPLPNQGLRLRPLQGRGAGAGGQGGAARDGHREGGVQVRGVSRGIGIHMCVLVMACAVRASVPLPRARVY